MSICKATGASGCSGCLEIERVRVDDDTSEILTARKRLGTGLGLCYYLAWSQILSTSALLLNDSILQEAMNRWAARNVLNTVASPNCYHSALSLDYLRAA